MKCFFFFRCENRRHGAASSNLDTGRQDFLVYVLSLLRGHSNEHGDSLPKLDVSSLRHVAYVLDALVYYIRNNPNASSQANQSSAEKTVATDTANDDEGGDDVDDEDSASFKRDAEEYEDDTDHVEDEPMPTPNLPGNLHRFDFLCLLLSLCHGANVRTNISNPKDLV